MDFDWIIHRGWKIGSVADGASDDGYDGNDVIQRYDVQHDVLHGF